jgi:hypothetical protein
MRIGTRSILVANPFEKDFTRKRWVLYFGAVGTQYVLVFGGSLENALEEAAAALVDANMPGYFIEPEVEDGSTHDCPDGAEGYPCTCDLTYTESGYLPSWEWGIALEDPTREQLIAFHKGE